MDTDDERLADIKNRYERHKSEMAAIHSGMQNTLIARWRSVAGTVADAMLASPNRALQEAEFSASHQVVAIDIISQYWKISGKQEVLDALQRILGTSSNEFVRSTAIRAVSAGLAGTQNQFWLRFLAEIVETGNETKIVRSSAYFALFKIAGRPVPIVPDANILRDFNEHFPENVDWRFVNRCISGDI